jgi:triacylglycerol lipase
MSRRLPLLLAVTAVLAAAAAIPATASARRPPGPALKTPAAALRQSLSCRGRLAGATRDPVLLVHGTFADSDINWSWNYKKTLPARGQTACTVDLPDRSAGDIQASTEYVVYAIRRMARRSGRKVAIVGHSQGGLEARWALRWWPDIRRRVSDLVMLATPNQGSLFPDNTCNAPSTCAASLYQMRSDSAFLAELNRGRQTVEGVSYTAIVTNDDKVFVLPQQGRLAATGRFVSNIAVQSACPGHVVDHQSLAFDGPAYAIVADALTHRGPARLRRLGPSACARGTMPGVDPSYAAARLAAYTSTLVQLLGPSGPKAAGEPPLACYATGHCR